MRATKENSKLEMTFDSLGDCCISYCGSTDIKVLEIPKVWREGGKQFRVTNLSLPYFSKKVVVTLCGSSNPSGLLEKLADCMDGLNVVWQTRELSSEGKELALLIVFVE